MVVIPAGRAWNKRKFIQHISVNSYHKESTSSEIKETAHFLAPNIIFKSKCKYYLHLRSNMEKDTTPSERFGQVSHRCFHGFKLLILCLIPQISSHWLSSQKEAILTMKMLSFLCVLWTYKTMEYIYNVKEINYSIMCRLQSCMWGLGHSHCYV